jgi:hypothetical protein
MTYNFAFLDTSVAPNPTPPPVQQGEAGRGCSDVASQQDGFTPPQLFPVTHGKEQSEVLK